MIRSGSGEDGPTTSRSSISQPSRDAQHAVFRPADAVETPNAGTGAGEPDRSTVLALSRQALTPARTKASADNLCSSGGYELIAAQGEARVSLYASGSEVEIAVAAQKALAGRASRRGWCRYPRWNCCWRSRRTGARRSSAMPRSRSRSRQRCGSAGTR